MIDKAEIKGRFCKSVASYDDNAQVQKLIVNQLYCLLENHLVQNPHKVLEIGCGTGFLTDLLIHKLNPDQLVVNDLVEGMCRKTLSKFNTTSLYALPGDIEEIPINGHYDLVVSASTFQWFAHPAETLAKLAGLLQEDGWLVYSTFGPHNLYELRSVTGKGLSYPSIDDIVAMLSPYFEIVQTCQAQHTLYFPEPLEILRHVKKTGVNAVANAEIWTKSHLFRFSEEYTRQFLSEEGYPLTYEPLYFVCRKK